MYRKIILFIIIFKYRHNIDKTQNINKIFNKGKYKLQVPMNNYLTILM